jgi:hypothetical protein
LDLNCAQKCGTMTTTARGGISSLSKSKIGS